MEAGRMTHSPRHLRRLATAATALVLTSCAATTSRVDPGPKAPEARTTYTARGAQTGPATAARSGPAWTGAVVTRCRGVEPLMREAAVRHTVDIGLIAGLIRVESSFRAAVTSRAGAVGLMQVMPRNAERLECGELTDPRSNIDCGLRVLKRFLKYYDNDLIYALSGYNAGFRRPNEARERGEMPSNHRYVEKVLSARAAYLRRGCGT